MAGYVRPVMTVEVDSRRLIAGMIEQAGERTESLVRRMGQEMVDEVEEIVRLKLPSSENSKPYETSLVNSFTYKVERGPGRGGYPWRVSLTIKPGVSKGKIAALNWGVTPRPKAYTILPRNVPRALEFKNPDQAVVARDNERRSKKGGGSAYENRVLRPSARRTSTSGPREGHFFLEEARANVLRRYGIDDQAF